MSDTTTLTAEEVAYRNEQARVRVPQDELPIENDGSLDIGATYSQAVWLVRGAIRRLDAVARSDEFAADEKLRALMKKEDATYSDFRAVKDQLASAARTAEQVRQLTAFADNF